ncbi:hypothetical protein TSUD_387130 [Trifolium subterraneum]|uniref:Uncharacterized protein n=1 Tax=Trifolium subterraneum TaxID=3900 RepID=A0A2Z6NU34_TRISU|nr:hypothetical protein TSUD_387130 [Trifolium subterraneum]
MDELFEIVLELREANLIVMEGLEHKNWVAEMRQLGWRVGGVGGGGGDIFMFGRRSRWRSVVFCWLMSFNR